MSAHMKERHTKTPDHFRVFIETGSSKKVFYNISSVHRDKLEKFLEKYSEDEEGPVDWEDLAKERIGKYKKSGLVLRGMRHRENLSQTALAKKSGISQNEISKIENGKRVVGEKVAKKLAKALHMDYHLFFV